MKPFLSTLGLLLYTFVHGQVIIGEGKSSLSSPSISIEFGNENKGIVLPWVNSSNEITPVSGTLVLDLNDRKVKVKLNNEWMNLTNASDALIDTALQDGLSDQPQAKVSIGTPTNIDGILVLEDSDKAMQLPMVESPHLNIINPAPGMIAYDTRAKLVCIFNGTEWSFWIPE